MFSQLATLLNFLLAIQLAFGTAVEMSEEYAGKEVQFSEEIFKQIAESDKNIIFSPLSIHIAGGLLYSGAEGRTANELSEHFFLPSTDKLRVAESFGNIYDVHRDSPMIRITNGLFAPPTLKIEPEFEQIADKYYHSMVHHVNFAEEPALAVKTINKWAEKSTDGKITEIISEDDIDAQTRTIVTNAIYFKGNWKNRFSKDQTQVRPFNVNEKETVDVDMMLLQGGFDFAHNDEYEASVINLDYDDNDGAIPKLSMLLVVPDEVGKFTDLEKKISQKGFKEVLKTSFSENKMFTRLRMPKFKIEYSVKLKDALEKMGVEAMFGSDANFKSYTPEPIYVKDIVHKAVIEVNEEGTQAAATSTAQHQFRGLREFVVNRSFLFFIKGGNNEIYFMGQVVKPTPSSH